MKCARSSIHDRRPCVFLELIMRRESTKDQGAAILFLLPAFFFFAIFIVYPFVDGLVLSFSSWDGFSAPAYAGLGNYKELFRPDGLFFKSLGNNSLFALYTVIGKNLLAL